jgi:hypothetical protein
VTEDQALIPSLGVLPSGGYIVSNPDFHLPSMESKKLSSLRTKETPGCQVTHKGLLKQMKIGYQGYRCDSIAMDNWRQ